jgi:hypothetical protein
VSGKSRNTNHAVLSDAFIVLYFVYISSIMRCRQRSTKGSSSRRNMLNPQIDGSKSTCYKSKTPVFLGLSMKKYQAMVLPSLSSIPCLDQIKAIMNIIYS